MPFLSQYAPPFCATSAKGTQHACKGNNHRLWISIRGRVRVPLRHDLASWTLTHSLKGRSCLGNRDLTHRIWAVRVVFTFYAWISFGDVRRGLGAYLDPGTWPILRWHHLGLRPRTQRHWAIDRCHLASLSGNQPRAQFQPSMHAVSSSCDGDGALAHQDERRYASRTRW